MRPSLTAAAAVAALALAPAAHADDDHHKPRHDRIILQLQAEDWVDTQTARVVAVVNTVLSGEQAGMENSRVPSVLNELAPGATWHVVSFDRSRDQSGLERWRITAEARLPEDRLGGLYDKARASSKPGQQVEIAAIDFTPTLAEREATGAKLRAAIYAQAAEEAKRAAQVWPDRGYRVQRVDFAYGGMPRPAPPRARAMAAAPAVEGYMHTDAGGGMGVSERLVLTATVVLAAPPPERQP